MYQPQMPVLMYKLIDPLGFSLSILIKGVLDF